MQMGQTLEVNCDSHNRCSRIQNITDLRDIQSEAARCVNCGCIAVNASDMAPALLALGAKIRTTKRIIKADAFFAVRIMKCIVLDDNELVQEIDIPAPSKNNRQGYQKFRIRNAIDFPIVSLAYCFNVEKQTIKDARIVLGAVAPIPLRARGVEEYLEGKPVSDETAMKAGGVAVQTFMPLAKNRFKVQIVKALLRKMVE